MLCGWGTLLLLYLGGQRARGNRGLTSGVVPVGMVRLGLGLGDEVCTAGRAGWMRGTRGLGAVHG